MSILALVLVIGIIISVYVFIKNQEIKATLDSLEQSEFVEKTDTTGQADIDSEVTISRQDGSWTVSENGDYTIDPESLSLSFTGFKIGGEHTGTFNRVDSTVSLDDNGSPVSISMVVMPESVETDTESVDKHLQDSVFFDTDTYKEVIIVVDSFVLDRGEGTAVADITIKGITKTVQIPVTVDNIESGTIFAIDTKIKISEWNMAFGPVLDDVRVMLEGTIVKK